MLPRAPPSSTHVRVSRMPRTTASAWVPSYSVTSRTARPPAASSSPVTNSSGIRRWPARSVIHRSGQWWPRSLQPSGSLVLPAAVRRLRKARTGAEREHLTNNCAPDLDAKQRAGTPGQNRSHLRGHGWTSCRWAALREAFGDLPPSGQQLIALLLDDPPVPYAEISATLGILGRQHRPPAPGATWKTPRHHPAIAALNRRRQ